MTLDELINCIIRDEEGREFRIINIDYIHKVVNIINVDEKSLPEKREIDDFVDQINNGSLKVLERDMYMVSIIESDLKDSEKKIRDERFNIIYPIISNDTINLCDKKQLNDAMKEIANENKLDVKTVKRYLLRYLARGENKNALIPDYYKCGGLNKEKKLGDKKTGRPKVYNSQIGEGINITDEIKEIFEKSVKKFYRNPESTKFTDVYYLMIGEYFKDNNGDIKPDNELPTIEQFRYWYKKKTKVKSDHKSRKSQKEYNLRMRPLIGTSLQGAQYPTSVFQIDSTQGNIKIVSTFNRNNVIGNPTIYIVIDVFSRMITGYYAGLQNASWNAAKMAIYNCTRDKVELCKYYGVDIREDEWNSRDLPDILVCDKGTEFTGENIENMANCLNIDIKNAPPYRPDLKGIVESVFEEIKESLISAPGAFKSQIKERGEENPAEAACLDINEINRIIIACIINHNNKFMNDYKRNTTMIEDDVKSIPTEIWDWGMKNLVGYKPKLSDNVIKLGLMPRDKATVTERGIKFQNMYYICKQAIDEGWLQIARKNKTWKVDIAYDPGNMNNIYLIKETKRDYIVCTLKKSEDRYLNKTYDEVISLHMLEQELKSEYKYHNTKKEVEKNNRIKKIVKSGKMLSKKYKIKTGQIKNNTKQIRENRKVAKERSESKESLTLNSNSKTLSINETIIQNEKEIYDENNIKVYENQEILTVDEAYRKRKNKLNKKLKKFQEENLNKGGC